MDEKRSVERSVQCMCIMAHIYSEYSILYPLMEIKRSVKRSVQCISNEASAEASAEPSAHVMQQTLLAKLTLL